MVVLATSLAVVPERVVAVGEPCHDRTGATRRAVWNDPSLCLAIGGGLLRDGSEYRTEDRSVGFGLVNFAYGPVFWNTDEAGITLHAFQAGGRYREISLLLELPVDGFDVDRQAHLSGLSDRDPTLEAGVMFEAGGRWGEVGVVTTMDLEAEHGGVRVQARYAYHRRFGGLTLSPELSLLLRDVDNGDFYYGVAQGEVGIDRPAYGVGEATIGPGFGYTLSYGFGNGFNLFHSLQQRVLDDLLADSPLTVDEEPFAVTIGFLHRLI